MGGAHTGSCRGEKSADTFYYARRAREFEASQKSPRRMAGISL
jgi:hypothetical protein